MLHAQHSDHQHGQQHQHGGHRHGHQHQHGHRHYVPAFGSDRMLPFYDVFTRLLGSDSYQRDLVAQAEVVAGQRVLDLGTGTGNLALHVKRSQPGAMVLGVDPDPLAIGQATRKAANRKQDVAFQRAFGQHLPFLDACFDRVVSSFMLHHLDDADQAAMLGEIRRVLKPGGRLHVLDVVRTDEHNGVLAQVQPDSPLHNVADGALVGMLESAGFRQVAEVSQRRSRMMGKVAMYRASAG